MKIKEILKNHENRIPLLLSLFVLGLGTLLCFFIYVTGDETVYIYETYMMSELLKKGLWIGNYPVGIHGTFFKVPAALLFIFFGPSVFAATFINVIYACLSTFLSYKIIKTVFNNSLAAAGGTLVLITNYNFMISLPTFLREIPVLLAFFNFYLFSYHQQK